MTAGGGIICGVSVAHDVATLADLEAADVENQELAVAELLEEPGVSEAFALRTCNRVEGYVVVSDPADGRAALSRLTAAVEEDSVRTLDHEGSLRHLLRVAAGLESQIVGEDEILGQVREAFEDARRAGGIGPILDDGLSKALQVGKRARTETAINDGVVSLASAAVREATAARDLSGATGLVVGAGNMGRRAATALGRAIDHLVIANRTVSNAVHLAETVEVDARPVSLEGLADAASEAAVIVAATGSPHHLLDRSTLAGAGETFVVDIAQPRDVAPEVADLEEVSLRDLDTIETQTAETRRQRQAAAAEVETMIESALDRLLTQYKRQRADRVISAMYEGAERIKAEELDTALRKLNLDADEAAVVEAMADAIVSQLLAAPTDSLRDAAEADDWSTIHTAIQLFDPSELGVEDAVLPNAAGATIPAEVREQLPAAVREQLED
jgi:glutamyl-tRNA reductase